MKVVATAQAVWGLFQEADFSDTWSFRHPSAPQHMLSLKRCVWHVQQRLTVRVRLCACVMYVCMYVCDDLFEHQVFSPQLVVTF